MDCNINRSSHPETEQIVFPQTPSRDPIIRQSSSSTQMGRQSLDLRDVVKDSMYREARSLSHTTTPKEDALDHMVHHRESLNARGKPQEVNWYCDEPRELSRSKSYQFRDGSIPQFSYDGRETNRLSFESRENAKMITPKQLKELTRLSLDSRESSMRSINSLSQNKASISRNPKDDDDDDVISANEGLVQTRPPSVVAKLMGLETLPGSAPASDNKLGVGSIRTRPKEDLNFMSKTDIFGPIKMQNSSRSSLKEPTSPCWKNPDMKPISLFPIEPAPWKQREGGRSPQKQASRVIKSPTKIHSPFSSVYSEVDRRLKYLEFTESGKDLRALKQILEAMQSIEASRKGGYSIATQNERFSDHGSSHQYPPSANRKPNHQTTYESPIVIMKPAKLVERSDGDNRKIFTNSRVGKDSIPKVTTPKSQLPRTAQTSTKRQQQLTTSSGSVSPRLQQKKLESERRSRPPMPPMDSSKPRKQQPESSSPGGRRRPKYLNIQQNDDQYSEISSASRKLTKESQMSQQFNSDTVSKIDSEVTASECSEEIDSRQSLSSVQDKSTFPLREDESLAPEYPSPVSVLDDAVYMDDSPSPVKHMLKALKDDTTRSEKIANDHQWESSDNVISNTINSGVTSEINRKKLEKIENLVQKLTRLNSGHDEAHTDYIASLCENTKPDHRYISEILLASGLLLRDLKTFQFHSSGNPINPELFLVLEQTKFSNLPKEKLVKKDKLHRKLIFDTINEILVGKLRVQEVWSRRCFKVAPNAQKLLWDLCLEIEELQATKENKEEEEDGLKSILWEDVLNRSENWTDYDGEIPVIALEVERLIFKDLVNEVVLGEASDGRRVKAKAGRRCRKLFSN